MYITSIHHYKKKSRVVPKSSRRKFIISFNMDHWLLAWLVAADIMASVTVGKGNALNWMGFLYVMESPSCQGDQVHFPCCLPRGE